ncbi:TadE/TadG family type IV pilus assembly protein [Pseudokineococcus marinus]|uniref:Pilus assembly protein n=1 Tax=Pseudokineococcus marinus TaxID=351215 RepID=A0A849BNY5_9ACTN|nr:TadE/TadG family type IV pilus assembly protein [Pseudokineococcus marinus]NNH24381.1 pilus assembly protein [Pseudokineococcus marinus]
MTREAPARRDLGPWVGDAPETDAPRRHAADRGSMSVEVVVVAPLLLLLVVLVLAMGRVALLQGDVDAAARDAARAASVERTPGAAAAAAQAALDAVASPDQECAPAALGGTFAPGGQVEVTVSCTVPMRTLTGLGLGPSITLDATGAAPLETFRRTG